MNELRTKLEIMLTPEENFEFFFKWQDFIAKGNQLIWTIDHGILDKDLNSFVDHFKKMAVVGKDFYLRLKEIISKYLDYSGEMDFEINFESGIFGFVQKPEEEFNLFNYLCGTMNLNEEVRKKIKPLVKEVLSAI